jgi:ATP-binding cassette subfamily B protein RaxB
MNEITPSLLPVRRLKLVRQSEVAECGLASLTMILNYWGARTNLAAMRRRFGLSARGVGLGDLMTFADQLGMASRPLRMELDDLPSLALPAILHWDLSHFVVVERVKGTRAWIADPATGERWHDQASLSRHFSGVALELSATNDFAPLNEGAKLRMRQLWSNMQGLKRALAQVALLSLLLQLHVLAAPYLLQIAVDHVMPALDLDLLTVLGVGFGLFACIFGAAQWLRANVLLSSGVAISFAIAANLGRRLMRLPVAWHQKRSVGTIIAQFRSVLPVEKLLTESAGAAAVDGLMALVTLAMMIVYSPLLALVPVASLIAYVGVRLGTLSAERATENERIVAEAEEQTVMIETLQGMVSLRLGGGETRRHAMWQNRLSEALGARYAHDRIRALQQAAALWLAAIEQVALVWLATKAVIAGGFSVGMVFAFLGYQLSFSTAARRLVDEATAFRLLGLHLDRLSDIALEPEDVGFAEKAPPPAVPPHSLSVRGVTYSYSQIEAPVIRDMSLTIEAGEYVALTGPSGGGKSTLVKLLLGLLEPEAGTVLVGDVPLARYGRRNLRLAVGAVLQDDHLFDGDIAQNVTAFGPLDEERLAEVLAVADIAEDIAKMPMGVYTMVGAGGSNLSGGQRQRVLLARALYRRPSVLVMDEGTAHLDPASERRVNAAIGAMGITRIVVAHRAETIASARRVVEIQDGQVVRDELRPS